jgi:hypothetical protein
MTIQHYFYNGLRGDKYLALVTNNDNAWNYIKTFKAK